MSEPQQPNWITDAKALRALAHPLRWQLLQQFDMEETMTATRCAEITGESVASCSYHLNTLARYGFVEAAESGSGRERPWRLVAHYRSWRAGGEGLDDEGAIAAVGLSDIAADEVATHLKQWFRWRGREEPRWVEATGFTQELAYLTPDELAAMTAELRAIAHRYADRRDPGRRPEGARAVRVVTSTSMGRPPEGER